MAARSRAIESRLERLAPSLEELYVAGIIDAERRNAVARTRMTHEYKLVARPLLAIDVRNAIDFELELEATVAAFINANKVQLKNRWAMMDRVEAIYLNSIPRLSGGERVACEDDFIAFLRRVGRAQALSRYLAEQVAKSPREPRYWVLTAEWEAEQGNMDNARAATQRALELLPDVASVWGAALFVELEFVRNALSQVRADDANAGRKAAALREENDALGQILIDLQLCRTVATSCLASPAFARGGFEAIVEQLTAQRFTRDLAGAVLAEAMRQADDADKAAAVVRGLAKLAPAWPQLLTPAAFVELPLDAPAQPGSPEDITTFALRAADVYACRCPNARDAYGKQASAYFKLGAPAPVVDLMRRRFKAEDWSSDHGLELADKACDVSRLVEAVIPEVSELPASADDAAVASRTLQRLREVGLFELKSSRVLQLEQQVQEATDSATSVAALASFQPNAVDDWRVFELRALHPDYAASGRKRRGGRARPTRDRVTGKVGQRRSPTPSSSSSDDEGETSGPVADIIAGLKFVLSESRDRTTSARTQCLQEALAALAKTGVLAAIAEARRVAMTEVPSIDCVVALNASALSALLDRLQLVVAAIDPLTVGVADALMGSVVPGVTAVISSKHGAASESLKNRALTLARRCYERALQDSNALAGDYAAFEINIARRPDLASNIRRKYNVRA